MSVPAIVYLQPMTYPSQATHSIQITRTIAALGCHVDVRLVVSRLTVPADEVPAAIRRWYGVDLGPRVTVVAPSRRALREPLFPFTIRSLLDGTPPGAVVYTRSLPIARRLGRWRRVHGRRVFLETHKKMGYLREDPVADSRYENTRRRFERAGESTARIRRAYASADCVFFLHWHSLLIARRLQPLRDVAHLWYGLRRQRGGEDRGRGTGFVYCGSLAEHKLISLLCDALDRVRSPIVVHVYGGDAERIVSLQRAIRGRPCAGRLEFLGRRPHADLQPLLGSYRYGIALQEGLKLVDYLERGLTPILPALTSYHEVLDDRHAIFFRPDDPDSLAAVLDTADARTADPVAVDALCDEYSVERRAATILAKLS